MSSPTRTSTIPNMRALIVSDWEKRRGRVSSALYRRLGDPRYESREALERRLALLKSPAVVRACRQFWDTLLLEEKATLPKSRYLEVHRLLTAALAPELTECEVREAGEEDFRDDLRGRATMDLDLLLMSIFE